jgi:hypothetical protein
LLRRFDLATGKPLPGQPDSHGSAVTDVAVTPDGAIFKVEF